MLYVNDILIFGDKEQVKAMKKFLSENFDMKDMGYSDIILGIKIIKVSSKIFLFQLHYIEKILEKFSSVDCSHLVSTSFDSSLKLIVNDGRAIAQLQYASTIGCLMYLMICRRPNTAFVVGIRSRFTSNLSSLH
jgi:hypothetical protein